MEGSPAFTCLSFLFGEYGFKEKELVEDYVYFSKYNLPPIQLKLLKVNYTHLELSSYAIRLGEQSKIFRDRFEWAMKTLQQFSKDSKQ